MAVELTGGLERFGLSLEQAKNLPPGKRLAVARYCVRFGHYQDARDLLEHIVAAAPDRMLYKTWLVSAYLGSGQVEQADRLSSDLIAEFPESHTVIPSRAQALAARNDLEGAYEALKVLMTEPKESTSYWANLGIAAQRRGEWDEAGSALDRALRILRRHQEENPEDYDAPTYLWMALIEQGEHSGEDVSQLQAELEQQRIEADEKVKVALEKPDPVRRDPRPLSWPRRYPEPAPERPRAPAQPVLDSPPDPELQSRLQEFFGFSRFRSGQQEVIRRVLDGKSVLAVMPTGAGKSLCFQLPAMLLDGITLVVSPLIALMKDQLDGLPGAVQQQVTLINSTLEGDEIDRRLRDIREGKYKLVYAAPERLRQRPFLHTLRTRGVSLVVVDEAHCVSMWGHDFRPDYLFIGNALQYLGHPTVLAMTATANPEMRLETSDHFCRQLGVVSTGTYRKNLFLESVVVRSDEEKMRELIRLCRDIDGSGIVYTRSRQKAEVLSRLLRREQVRATYYHAGLEDEERARTQDGFMDGRFRVMCATVAFGMGIDKPDVRFVIHYSLPQSLEDYYQEAGRAGRDGRTSRCILLSTPSDKALVTKWMRDELMDAELPRKCYRYLREVTPDQPFAAVHADDLQRELGVDDTRIRVAIGMLEELALVKRHLDVPASMTVGLTPKGLRECDGGFAAFTESARLKVNQRVALDTMGLSRRTGVKPDELEGKLLAWRDDGWLTYWGSGRLMLLERLPAPRDARGRLESLISRFARAQEKRAETIFRYVETARCRHDFIAEHFGAPAVEDCASCDSCAPSEAPIRTSRHARPIEVKLTDEQKRRKILETVEMVSGQVGYTGLVRVLKGSIASPIKRDRCRNFGILANEAKTTIERCVKELLAADYISRDDSEYRLVQLGSKGLAELRK